MIAWARKQIMGICNGRMCGLPVGGIFRHRALFAMLALPPQDYDIVPELRSSDGM
ncbi:hypothetical protein ZHAS_00010581 [Anopheles sinensis]|uniref:Uncharacterized protein n=1 Tax=Anopheles sinensis TaxID=74873 RepID=A0A084VXY4_ANOSI|nr:hypothetical protein ZHAS_00010581 [Anopheles sinensis]